ncbi:hypothetical protein GCM10023075_04730 [Streptosporangium album]
MTLICDLFEIPHPVWTLPAEARLWINARPARVVQIAEALAQHPEISSAALTTGPTNLLAADG